MQIYDLAGPILSGSFACCDLMHYNPEILKKHSPDRVFSTVYTLILE